MKKSYNNPTIKVVKIQPMQMIAVSGDQVYDAPASSSKAVLSREARFSEWDEDEE